MQEKLLQIRQAIEAAQSVIQEALKRVAPNAKVDPQAMNSFTAISRTGADLTAFLTTPSDAREVFLKVCEAICALPNEYKIPIQEAARTAGIAPATVERYGQRKNNPMLFKMPSVLHALDGGIAIILGENEQDREFRIFYAQVKELYWAVLKAGIGTHWKADHVTRYSTPHQRVPEWDQDVLEIYARLREQFPKLDERFIRILNENLRLQTVRSRDIEYQSDQSSTGNIIRLPDTSDQEVIYRLACKLAHAVDIYYEEAPAFNVPEPALPTVQ